jgi:hypothetical protein
MASGNNNITVDVPGYGKRTGSVVFDGSQWLFYWNTITTTYSSGGGSGGGGEIGVGVIGVGLRGVGEREFWFGKTKHCYGN